MATATYGAALESAGAASPGDVGDACSHVAHMEQCERALNFIAWLSLWTPRWQGWQRGRRFQFRRRVIWFLR